MLGVKEKPQDKSNMVSMPPGARFLYLHQRPDRVPGVQGSRRENAHGS